MHWNFSKAKEDRKKLPMLAKLLRELAIEVSFQTVDRSKKIQIEKEDLEAESRRKAKNDAERARLIALVEAESERRRASENVCIISFRLITVSAAVSRSRCATDSASAGRRLNQQCIGYSDQLFVFFNRSKRKKHSRLLPSTLSGRPLRRARPSRRLLVTIC